MKVYFTRTKQAPKITQNASGVLIFTQSTQIKASEVAEVSNPCHTIYEMRSRPPYLRQEIYIAGDFIFLVLHECPKDTSPSRKAH